MSLSVSPLNTISFKASAQNSSPRKTNPSDKSNPNPISRKGEAANLVKATFIGGLALGGRLLWEIMDTGDGVDFLFETAGKKAGKIVDKTHKGVSSNKRALLWLGATAAIIAAAVSGFALLYTMANAKKIAYESKVNTFQKGKEMDVYIKANEAEREIYTQLSDKAKTSDEVEKEELKEQYMKMRMAKNRVPDFVKL